MPVVFDIPAFDASQVLWTVLACLRASYVNGLIATQSPVALSTAHEDCLCLMQSEATSEIGETPIRDVKFIGFW
jgi:hypothetical protein